MSESPITREGSLEAPTRHPVDWQSESFWNETELNKELERVFDICHGCRRCVSLCNAFPTLFDLVDESSTMEVDGVDKADYAKVVEQCYLCDMCYMSKCPYVPPHEWNVDFPHLMLRAKAVSFKKHGTSLRNRVLSDTNTVPKLASIPVVVEAVNALNANPGFRNVLEKTAGIHHAAPVPKYHSKTLRKRVAGMHKDIAPVRLGRTTGQACAVRDLLRQLQQPRTGRRFFPGFSAQRGAYRTGAQGAVLRHAEAGTRRPGVGTQGKGEPTSRYWPNWSTRVST